ncbi:MAG: hypothetical protein K9G26_09560 [Emcibacter sp.]|nr:hypothetical protein [Emcibacter sp.]
MFQIVRIFIYFICVTLIMSFVFVCFSPKAFVSTIDTEQINDNLTCDTRDVSHFVNNISLIKKSLNRKIFILGASNARDGFRPLQLNKLLPKLDTFNIAFSSGNVSEAILALDIIKAAMPEEVYQGSYAVLGAAFAVVVDDSIRWENSISPLENELLHYGLYAEQGDTISQVYSDQATDLILKAALPFRCGSHLIQTLTLKMRTIFQRKENKPRESWDKESAKVQFDKWEKAYKPEKETINREINNLIRFEAKVRQMKMIPIIVDLPFDKLVHEYSKHDKNYEQVMRNFLKNNSLNYINMRHMAEKSKFKDLLHPTKETAQLWGEFLATEISNLDNSKDETR